MPYLPAEPSLVLRHANVVDPVAGSVQPDVSVTVAGRRIVHVGTDPGARQAEQIDLRGGFVVPGLIDAHAHVTASSADYEQLMQWPISYGVGRAVPVMRGMLRRGFTTVRDVGGADPGLARAVDEGLLPGPRLRVAGKNLSRVDGPGTAREYGLDAAPCCHSRTAPGIACPDTHALLDAARTEIGRGVDHIKIALTGGVSARASGPEQLKFTADEVAAVVDVARAAGRYVAAHAYSAQAIRIALENGVRSIEHGNLMDDACPKAFVAANAFYVPTLITYRALFDERAELGLPTEAVGKISTVLETGTAALELAHRGGVAVAFGTDLMAGMHGRQNEEFAIRAEVQPAADVLRSATTVAADLLGMSGEIGVVAPSALADMVVVGADPLDDVRVLARAENIRLVIQNGEVVHANR